VGKNIPTKIQKTKIIEKIKNVTTVKMFGYRAWGDLLFKIRRLMKLKRLCFLG